MAQHTIRLNLLCSSGARTKTTNQMRIEDRKYWFPFIIPNKNNSTAFGWMGHTCCERDNFFYFFNSVALCLRWLSISYLAVKRRRRKNATLISFRSMLLRLVWVENGNQRDLKTTSTPESWMISKHWSSLRLGRMMLALKWRSTAIWRPTCEVL